MIKNYTRVILAIIKICKNWPQIIFDKIFGISLPEIILRDGTRFIIDSKVPRADLSMLAEIWSAHDYTPKGFEIGENDTILDIGANNGFFSIFAAKLASKGLVVAFEPVLNLAQKIKKNILINNINNIRIENMAVSDKSGSSIFYVSKVHNGCHSLFYRNSSDEETKVTTITLEKYCRENNITNIDLLKLDCEGAEYEIFSSLSNEFLIKNIKKISMEYHDNINSHTHVEIIKLLNDSDFSTTVANGYIYAKNENK